MKLFDFKFLSEEYPLEKAFFVVPTALLKFGGIWPFEKITLKLVLFNIFTLSCLAIGGAAEFAFVFANLNDPINALEGACPAVTITMTFLKYMYICYNRQDYKECINRCRELIFAGWYTSNSIFLLVTLEVSDNNLDQDPKKKKLIAAPMSFTSFLCFGTFVLAFMTNLTYFSRPLITIAIQHFSNQNITLLTPFPV